MFAMPLSPPAARKPIHLRQVRYEGFERDDGLFDIEATLVDTKPFAFEIEGEGLWQPEQPIHGMRLRLVIDVQFVVQDIEAVMDDVPHPECMDARAPMRRMIGCSVRKGWRRAIDERLGKVQGCAHLRELLLNMGTVAFQTLAVKLFRAQPDSDTPPLPMGGCQAWDPAGPMVARLYPRFHIRPADAAKG